MKNTTNYNLNKPDQTDFFDIDDLNANADILDSVIKGIDDKVVVATTANLGLVKPDGTTITINSDGVISGSSQVDIATVSKAGIVKPDGDSLSIDTSGKLTVEKVGGLAFSVDSDGILNVTYEED